MHNSRSFFIRLSSSSHYSDFVFISMASTAGPVHPFAPLTPSPLTVCRYELPPPPDFPSFTLIITQRPNNDVLVFPWTPIEYVPRESKLNTVQKSPLPTAQPVQTSTTTIRALLKFFRRYIANIVKKVKRKLVSIERK
ncbi:hypothetical protein MIND_00439000 [Mycena indigotica]|uniref:Uncharacterized protein n=1 Tax=Mycena indigotica TaxID=2126181 RepID=A0A8H6SY54_9AGAR|nr:uncharacterized protein MIND_00439000 [Mycena indigotica]KAF7306477.1 hypothetical protein MIND_00439000 [Mycena indigotica]